jgi:uncharacterized membrane protein
MMQLGKNLVNEILYLFFENILLMHYSSKNFQFFIGTLSMKKIIKAPGLVGAFIFVGNGRVLATVERRLS